MRELVRLATAKHFHLPRRAAQRPRAPRSVPGGDPRSIADIVPALFWEHRAAPRACEGQLPGGSGNDSPTLPQLGRQHKLQLSARQPGQPKAQHPLAPPATPSRPKCPLAPPATPSRPKCPLAPPATSSRCPSGGQVCGPPALCRTPSRCPSGRHTWAGVLVSSPHPLAPPATSSRCPSGGQVCGAAQVSRAAARCYAASGLAQRNAECHFA